MLHHFQQGSQGREKWNRGRGEDRYSLSFLRTVTCAYYPTEQDRECLNESTGRGQQLVACVWAARIRPLRWARQGLSKEPLAHTHTQTHTRRNWASLSDLLPPMLEEGPGCRGLPACPGANSTASAAATAEHKSSPDQTSLSSPQLWIKVSAKWLKKVKTIYGCLA